MSTVSASGPQNWKRLQTAALTVGIIALVVAVIGAFFYPVQFFRAYLAAYVFYLGLGLGSLAILMISHLTGGAWGYVSRRILEAGMRTLPLLAVLFIPIACGVEYLYLWAQPVTVAASHKLQYQQFYLNVPFFWGRAALYFITWLVLAYLFTRRSAEADRASDPHIAVKNERLSGIGLVIYGITVHFCSVDWIMSLQPDFHSTIFGPLVASGQLVSAQALLLIVLTTLTSRTPVSQIVSGKVMNDLGNLLLTFLVIWAYMEWFQFMLIWIANMQVDVIWYLPRSRSGWQWVAGALFIAHFAIPFLLLLSRVVKETPWAVGWVAALVCFMQLVFDYYQIMPSFTGTTIADHWMDFLTPFGIGGVWLAYFLWQLGRWRLLPRPDEDHDQALHLRHIDEEEQAREEVLAHG
jgi:hypothetical protein